MRVAGTTSLYEAGVPKKIIQEHTGHRCLQSLRHYERVTTEQDVAVSRILTEEIDAYEPKCEKPCHSPSMPQGQSTAGFSGVQYNNCTVNVFGSTRNVSPSFPPHIDYLPPATGYVPMYPPFPSENPCYSTPTTYPYLSEGNDI